MDTITLGDITRLLASNKQRANAAPKRWFDGETWHSSKPKDVGTFIGKAGTTRRFIRSESVVAYKV